MGGPTFGKNSQIIPYFFLSAYLTCFRSTALSDWMVMMIFTMEVVFGRIWQKSWGWRWGEQEGQRQCNADDETSALERCLTLEACAPHQLNRRDGWLTENGFSFPPDSWQSRVKVMENIVKQLKKIAFDPNIIARKLQISLVWIEGFRRFESGTDWILCWSIDNK